VNAPQSIRIPLIQLAGFLCDLCVLLWQMVEQKAAAVLVLVY